ncbi:dephospho-CoA kinase [Priestia koreensis]|uniref:dephospho-CoA kinase n=1 Tax=Priestia koreensis TaxID=284581 RepID=UPI001F5A70E0|nr:dephospho-CoA kinase [Priestia koreensis]MCM3002767.1 dephospho-CoA kinase [Priestia koreensis]UNL84463.1 dephospho-CoA kinase [Priestia koreensis]
MALVIGLTGGIASGKSTVSNMLKEMNIPVIDADVIAREVVEPGEKAYEQIVEAFGEEILAADKTLNRVKLGSMIFADEQKRTTLNGIVHPAVRQSMLSQKETLIEANEPIIVLDIPLLFESNLTHLVDKVLLVYVDESVQLERLIKRNDLSEQEATNRIASQMKLIEKVPLADAVINNNGSVEETKQQLLSVLAFLDK